MAAITYITQISMTPAVRAAVAIVTVMLPAVVIFLGAAKVVAVGVAKSAVREAFAVAAIRVFVALPPETPIATVADPEDVTAVVTFITPERRMASAGMVVFCAGVIVLTAPPSVAKL